MLANLWAHAMMRYLDLNKITYSSQMESFVSDGYFNTKKTDIKQEDLHCTSSGFSVREQSKENCKYQKWRTKHSRR